MLIFALPPAPSPVAKELARFDHLARLIRHDAPVAATLGVVLLAAVLAVRSLIQARRLRQWAEQARVIEICAPPQADPAGGPALWANLLGLHRPRWIRWLHGQPHLVFEYTAAANGVSIRMWIPGTVPPGLVEHAIEAAWPGARVLVLDHPTLPLPVQGQGSSRVEGGRLIPARGAAIPLRTKHEADPLRALFGAFTQLRHGEGACVQILARPASPSRARGLRRAVTALAGGAPSGALAGIGALLARLTPSPPVGRTHRTYSGALGRRDPRAEADARAAALKVAGPLWEAEIRYGVTVPRPSQRDAARVRAARGRARGLAHAVASAFGVHADRNYLRRRRLHHPARALQRRALTRGALYAVAELAGFAHLPTDAVIPGLARAGARPVAPAARIPSGPSGAAVRILGDADAGPARPLGVPVADARHHLHVIGATGAGKSTLLANLVLDDVKQGRGSVVIDPKGDLVADLLERLPQQAADRLVLFDPDDAAPPPRVNMFDGADPDVAVDHLTGIFKRIYAGFWGPRSDDLLRAACLTLIIAARRDPSLETPTLGHVPGLLTSEAMRHRYLAALTKGPGRRPGTAAPGELGVLSGFWAWYEQLSVPARAHVTAPLLNKLRAFLLREFAAKTVATGATSIDLRAVLDGGICLIRLPKGVLGDETVRLLGSFLVAKTWQAAAARARLGQVRRDATLVIDECHNFLTLPIGLEDMLAEARAYRLSLVLAHQNLAQLPADLREGISANARNKLIFNVSPEDARQLERHTLPALGAHDLSHLDAFHAAARLVIASAEQPACTLVTRPLPAPIPGRAAQMRSAIAQRAPVPQRTHSPAPAPGRQIEGS
jgi:hypothetical protein